MAKGQNRYVQEQVEDTSIELTTEGLKIESGNNIAIYLIIGLVAFFIYTKYWHKPAVRSTKRIFRRKK